MKMVLQVIARYVQKWNLHSLINAIGFRYENMHVDVLDDTCQSSYHSLLQDIYRPLVHVEV